jgi:hypothetical protein
MLDGTVGQYAPGGLPPPAAFAELAPAEPPELISLAVLGLEPPPEPEPEPAPAETEA